MLMLMTIYFFLQVTLDCSHVYVDGSETNGARNATIIFKHTDKIREVRLSVWVPEIPLNVEVSDQKLSQIKMWKGPDAHTR
jgi:transmembrane protein 132